MTEAETEFMKWMRAPAGTYQYNETCDTCDAPAVVTMTVDGKTSRACADHVAELDA